MVAKRELAWRFMKSPVFRRIRLHIFCHDKLAYLKGMEKGRLQKFDLFAS
jgi:hypothetical protein